MSMISIGKNARKILGSNQTAIHVIRDVITMEQEEKLINEVIPILKRRRYQRNHWDNVIVGYKEVERLQWNDPTNEQVVNNIRQKIENVVTKSHHLNTANSDMMKNKDNDNQVKSEVNSMSWLPVHIIDLEASGYISPHVDSIKFSGGLVCGLSLLSPSIMTLTKPKNEYSLKDNDIDEICKEEKEEDEDDMEFDDSVHMFLPPRSLYILSQSARYNMAHSVDIKTKQDISKAFKQYKSSSSSGGNNNTTNNEVEFRYHDDINKLDSEFVKIIKGEEDLNRSHRISLIFRDVGSKDPNIEYEPLPNP